MATKKRAEEKVVEKTTQEESPPSKETSTQAQTQTEKVEPKAKQSDKVSDVDERVVEEQRKAFQNMRLENKKLKEEINARKTTESAFDVFKQQPQQSQPIDIEQYKDPLTGEVDVKRYNQAVNQQFQQVQQIAQQATVSVDERIDESQARQKYPEVFEDPDLEEEIASRYLFAKLSGKDVSISGIAKKVSSRVSKTSKAAAKKALSEVKDKEQASLNAGTQTSASQQVQSTDDLEKLRRLSRQKGRVAEEAIAQRMKGIPWGEEK